jgi:glycyl-tRNA synthetase
LLGASQLEEAVPTMLAAARLEHGEVHVGATPRRLVVTVKALVPAQQDREERLRGPPAKAAFDKEGNPTKAAEGFCKKNGVELADVVREKDEKGVEYLYATVQEKV